jgi:hypothetical protein
LERNPSNDDHNKGKEQILNEAIQNATKEGSDPNPASMLELPEYDCFGINHDWQPKA